MTFDSVSQDFAFESGATKSPRIPGRDSFLIPQFGVLLFAFHPFCEMLAPQFAPGDTNVDTGGEFPSAADRPELGQDGTRWVRETAVPDVSAEFATSHLFR